jgi:hypothetical protein
MKDRIIKYWEPRLFTWSTLLGIGIFAFGIYYRKQLNDLVIWFFLFPARQFITNVMTDKSLVSEAIIGIIALISGAFVNKCRKNKD